MARAKNSAEKPKDGSTLTIDVASFVRTRDSVVTGLATLQDAIQTLSSAYIKHTNAVLGESGAMLDAEMSALAKLGDNPLLRLEVTRSVSEPEKSAAAAEPAGSDKKERKKRQHDPNAPKRPLTPFFLYMQTARPIIAQDLGADVAKGAVSAEGTRRWGVMADEDKKLWTSAYKDNLRLYNARMHSYKAGNLSAKDMTDEEAAAYAETHNISLDTTADAQLANESSAAGILNDEDADGEPDHEPPAPPPRTPAKAKGATAGGRASKAKPKSTPSAPVESAAPANAAATGAAAGKGAKDAGSEKKRKRSGKKEDEKEEAATETPKSGAKPRKKKAKNDA